MPSRGRGRKLAAGFDFAPEDLFPAGTDTAGATILGDYWWGGGPAAVTQIPFDWLIQPLAFRPDPPINVADITTSRGAQGHSVDTASRAAFGEYPPSGSTSLDSAVDSDAQNYATFLTAYYAAPRPRCPTITLDLLQGTDVERRLILAREIGDRIQITGVPSTWPAGTDQLVIEGIAHLVGLDQRQVVWNTAPIVGTTAGTPGPWFRLDSSRLAGTDVVPF